MQNFLGKKALVIGGSGGIGADICRELAKKESSLIVHGSRNSDSFDKLLAELNLHVDATKIVHFFENNFSKNFEKSTLIKSVKSADIICICFGPFMQKKLHDMDVESWEQMIHLNLLLPSLVVSLALPQMMEKQWGRFLLFGGTRTERVNAFESNAAYGAAKTALSSLVRSTALGYARYGITCNAIFPGFTKTEYVEEEVCVNLAKKMPQKRMVESKEIAKTAVHILEQPMMNGALVNIDGGWDPSF